MLPPLRKTMINLFHSDLNLSVTLKTEGNRSICQVLWTPMSPAPEDVRASQQDALIISHTSLIHPYSSTWVVSLIGKSEHATALLKNLWVVFHCRVSQAFLALAYLRNDSFWLAQEVWQKLWGSGSQTSHVGHVCVCVWTAESASLGSSEAHKIWRNNSPAILIFPVLPLCLFCHENNSLAHKARYGPAPIPFPPAFSYALMTTCVVQFVHCTPMQLYCDPTCLCPCPPYKLSTPQIFWPLYNPLKISCLSTCRELVHIHQVSHFL